VKVDPPLDWRAIVAFPAEPLPTSKARAVLPATYAMNDVVANLQSVAALSLAFAQSRGDLLRFAMNDRIHQPYRAPFCPLLPLLAPLVGKSGILGVALSGAGPAVLLVVDQEMNLEEASSAIMTAVENHVVTELTKCRFSRSGAAQLIESKSP
jgi:homoserine kinase